MKTLLYILFFLLLATSARAADTAPFPAPPMQGKPWTPPATKLPPVVVSAIKELFNQGLADPRGCEYREVEIANGNESGPKTTTLHAWVLPGNGATRYAVSWNGRVIPVVSVGDPVDLGKALRKLFPPAPVEGWNPSDGDLIDFMTETEGSGASQVTNESGGFSEKTALPIKVALLLRLGEAGLAELVWKSCDKQNNDPYLDMAREWLIPRYRVATGEHSGGNDTAALRSFRALLPLAKSVESTAALRGIPRPDAGKPYLPEMSQLPELMADQERRAGEKPYTPASKANLPDGPARIAALIHDLELVKGEEMTIPGETDYWGEPIVLALTSEGDAAVEPLIACLEEDPPRLTRTVYTSNFMEGPVVRVYEPAYYALCSILKVKISLPLPADTSTRELSLQDRKALAAKFRAYWSKNKDLPDYERWYAELKDDHATPHDWLVAADAITKSANETDASDLFSRWDNVSYGADTASEMRGEPLRSKTNPSVSDLLVTRFNQLLPMATGAEQITVDVPGKPGAEWNVGYPWVARFLTALVSWDGKARLNDVKQMARALNGKFPAVGDRVYPAPDELNSWLFERRVAFGDPDGYGDYERWLESKAPKTPGNTYGTGIGDYAWRMLPALFKHPGNPEAVKLAGKLFASKNSPWVPVTPQEQYSFSELAHTELLRLPAFRDLIEHNLEDTGVIGFIRIPADGNPLTFLNGERDNDPQYAALPKMEFRVCDQYASSLAEMESFPAFKLTWPEKQRDAAIAICKRLVGNYGGDFQAHPKLTYTPTDGTQGPLFELAALDHPATSQDVEQGRAIFSLPGKSRLCAMPQYPLLANRPASRDEPFQTSTNLPNGESVPETIYSTSGLVWQAEEEWSDGKWERFYGFSGRHEFEKVPAAEVEFPSDSSWTPVSQYMDAKLEIPKIGQVPLNKYNSYWVTDAGSPLVVTIRLRNHSGLDRPVPGALLLPTGANKTLPSALGFTLSYTDRIPPEAQKPASPPAEASLPPSQPVVINLWSMDKPIKPFDYGDWHEVPQRKEVEIAPAQPDGEPLGAAHERDLVQIDLNDYFDLSRPGSYRVQAVFNVPGEPAAKSFEYAFSVVKK